MTTMKYAISMAALPIAQTIVRHAPSGRVREWVWRWGKWRAKEFVTRASGITIQGNTLDLIQGYLFWFGVWEPNLTEFVRRRMNEAPGRTFVDVGANIGYFTAFVAKHFPAASVVAIEAFPPTVEKLRASIIRNQLKNVRVIAAAASDATGSLEIFYAGNSNEGATTAVPGAFNTVPVVVPSRPLAEMLNDEEFAAIRLVKIDVEGAESKVIAGLAPKIHCLRQDAEIVVEVSASNAGSSAFIFDLFRANGFHAYELENNYDPLVYLYRRPVLRPRRLDALPSTQTDVVFSRINADYL